MYIWESSGKHIIFCCSVECLLRKLVKWAWLCGSVWKADWFDVFWTSCPCQRHCCLQNNKDGMMQLFRFERRVYCVEETCQSTCGHFSSSQHCEGAEPWAISGPYTQFQQRNWPTLLTFLPRNFGWNWPDASLSMQSSWRWESRWAHEIASKDSKRVQKTRRIEEKDEKLKCFILNFCP